MALFTDLHDVVQLLSEHISEEIGIVDVQPGAPREAGATTEAGVRITLLYATPEPTHRNDPAERQPDGTRRAPPLSLSCTYLVTTTGADADDPIAAHHALGRIMTLYHDQPVLSLPLSDRVTSPPGTFSELGDGLLNVGLVPMALDQIDKIWTSVDVQLQPWALFEVRPVQLLSVTTDEAALPVIRPGGIGSDVRGGARPQILRVAPELVRPGGRVRVDALLKGELERVFVAGTGVDAGDPSLVVADAGSPLLLTLGGDLGEGVHALTVQASGLVSRRAAIAIAAPSAPTVDAPPALSHDLGSDLVLTGANLAGAQEAVLWPDVGTAAPPDVFSLAVSDVSAGGLTVPSAGAPGLADLPRGRGPWRLTIRIGNQVYTPYVVVEAAG